MEAPVKVEYNVTVPGPEEVRLTFESRDTSKQRVVSMNRQEARDLAFALINALISPEKHAEEVKQ